MLPKALRNRPELGSGMVSSRRVRRVVARVFPVWSVWWAVAWQSSNALNLEKISERHDGPDAIDAIDAPF
jgi:hypothetical protein